ncbi:MAG TPA: hypothetical protein VM580_28495, partial [Labilithrix sp.]|nr:hypothetical protein [Labilithrix sp.]
MSRLAHSSGGAVAVHDRFLVFYDVRATRIGEHQLDKRVEAVARFGDEWLVLAEKQKHLARVSDGGAKAPFASGRSVIGTFGVGRDDAVAVARGGSLEFWSRDDERCWSTSGGPFSQAVVARDHVVALGEDGALYFFDREKGEALGALRLASPDPCSGWRLALIDGGIVVLALGEWLVWIDAATRKTVRRVRARAKVVEIAADSELVTVALEDGYVQAFRAATGEPRAAFAAHDGSVAAMALGPGALYTLSEGGGADAVRVCDRHSLDVTVRTSAPVSALAARGDLAAVGDRAGRVRVFAYAAGALRESGALSGPEPAPRAAGITGLFVAKDESVVAAGTRVVIRALPPYAVPRALPLRNPPTAFAADDGYAFVGTQTGVVDVYDLASSRHVTTYALSSDDRITALVRLAGTMLVVGTGALDGRVLVVDVVDAKVVHRVSPHDEAFG